MELVLKSTDSSKHQPTRSLKDRGEVLAALLRFVLGEFFLQPLKDVSKVPSLGRLILRFGAQLTVDAAFVLCSVLGYPLQKKPIKQLNRALIFLQLSDSLN